MQRAKFKSINYGRCVILTEPDGTVREFHIPYTSSGYGYIREGSNSGHQICEGLSHSGNTLSACPETLLTLIRREWVKCKRNRKFSLEY